MDNFVLAVFCAIFMTAEVINGQPITKEEADSLLPGLPKTKNETVAAIVQDAVVQQAVESVVGDGSLSGLIVKKNTVILPVNAPDVVLSHQEQILTAPLSDLENIRRNITQTVATLTENENSDVTELDEISLAEIIPFKGDLPPAEVTPSLVLTPEIKKNGNTDLPEKVFTQSLVLTGVIGDKIPDHQVDEADSEPKSRIISDSIESKTAASESSEESSSVEENSSEENGGEPSKGTLEFGARIPVTVIAAEKSDLRPAVEIESRSTPKLGTEIEGDDLTASKKDILAIFTLSDEGLYDQFDENDMTVAEDIIFRPLFRYRQQQNERTRILENRAYQKIGYRRYDNKRRRPSSAANSYSDYNYNYKKPHITRYYDGY